MSKAKERIAALVAVSGSMARWTGAFDEPMLERWLTAELGDSRALGEWVPHGPVKKRAVALSPVLHVASGNTPHAIFQSVMRGLLVGCMNRVKLPSAGLPEFEDWVENLPPVLANLLEVRHDLPDSWLDCEAAVIFGNAETIGTFRWKLRPEVMRIEHGPKLGIGVIFEASADAAENIAKDILEHDQRGCMSVQAVYVDGTEDDVLRFGDLLADKLGAYRALHGRGDFTLSDSGAVSNARELARYRIANGDVGKLWESPASTAWTVLYEADPRLSPGPLNGFVKLHRLPDLPDQLGAEKAFVSTVAIHPFDEVNAAKVEGIGAPRICPAGKVQEPTLFWHHDGTMPLAGLVRWRDLG
jgi:hypothetical protein